MAENEQGEQEEETVDELVEDAVEEEDPDKENVNKMVEEPAEEGELDAIAEEAAEEEEVVIEDEELADDDDDAAEDQIDAEVPLNAEEEIEEIASEETTEDISANDILLVRLDVGEP